MYYCLNLISVCCLEDYLMIGGYFMDNNGVRHVLNNNGLITWGLEVLK